MKQISLQIANSTYHPLMANTPPQAFQPSNTDICVNALWFASLILSLTTASIGILVKQWLREYLSLHNPSPRARLRIRHYREPELRRWKVFEIAAVLPFLQQLSLALFFVGLCYFSASVHKTVGRTSLSLVVGWAFFICTVTILPLFFPRCPYKSTLLVSLHIHLVHMMWRVTGRMYLWSFLRPLRNKDWLKWLWTIYQSLSDYRDRHTEGIAIAEDGADLDILAEVDVAQSNDELIGTTIFESVQQIYEPKWEKILKLVFRILESRLQRGALQFDTPSPTDLQPLTRPAYNGVINILSHYLTVQFSHSGSEWQDSRLTPHALFLLFSSSSFPLPASGANVLALHGSDIIRIITTACVKSGECVSSLWSLFRCLTRRAMDDPSSTPDSSLRDFEVIVNAASGKFEGDNIPRYDSRTLFRIFTLEDCGDVDLWFSDDIWTDDVACEAGVFMAGVISRAVHRLTSLSTDHITLDTQSTICQTLPCDGTELTNPAMLDYRFAGAVTCVWYLAYKASMDWSIGPFQSTIHDCLLHRMSTVALLRSLNGTPESAVISLCAEFRRYGTPGGRFYSLPCILHNAPNAKSVTRQMQQNILDAIQDLTVTSSPSSEHRHAVPQLTLNHALKIICFGVHLVEPTTTTQYTDWYKTLFQTFTRLLIYNLPATFELPPSYTLTLESQATNDIADMRQTGTNDITHLADFIRSSPASLKPCIALAEASLGHIQWKDLKLYCPDWVCWMDGTDPEYEDWLTRFQSEDAVYENGFVECLVMIIIASRCIDLDAARDFDIDASCYRVRRLGLTKKVQDALAIHRQQ